MSQPRGRAVRREEEFAEFVGARRPHLRRIAYALCGDWHRADDLVQTALTKAYLAWPRIRRDGREEAYVRTIMVRANVDEHRRSWRREVVGLPAGDDVAARDGLPLEERSALLDALQALPAMQRKVAVLRHWLELSVAETAAELGISEGTVKSHSHRALAALAATLSPADAVSAPDRTGRTGT